MSDINFSFNTQNLVNLMHLDLSENNISRIKNLEIFPKLEVLQLQYNRIERIENLNNNKKLRLLNLSNNCISIVENIDGLINLKELSLAHQSAESSLVLSLNCFEDSVAIERLDLENNYVENASELAQLRFFRRIFKRNQCYSD